MIPSYRSTAKQALVREFVSLAAILTAGTIAQRIAQYIFTKVNS
jgi:hypothetical protein